MKVMDKRMRRFVVLVAAVFGGIALLYPERDARFFAALTVLGVLMIVADYIGEINEQYREYKRTGKLPPHVLEKRRRRRQKLNK